MNRVTVFYVTTVCASLLGCSGDTFSGFEGGAQGDADPSEASTDGDSGRVLEDGGGSDAPAESSAADALADSYVCPTGVQACTDALAALCARQKACNGTMTCDDMNTSTGQCSGKTICETPCLADIQNASCTWINQHSVSPAFVSGNCGALW